MALPLRAGIGLKSRHVQQLLDGPPGPAFLEVHAENCMGDGGPFHRALERLRERYPLSLHGVGLSLGGMEPPDPAHLERLAALVRRWQPDAFSEHLAWCGHGGTFLNDLLPLAYDDAALHRVCRHVDQVQARLGRRMLLENPSSYLGFDDATLEEAQFLSEVVARTGCGLLLDVNNAYLSCINRNADPVAYVDALPLQAVAEIHLAGFARDLDAAGAPLLIDHHGSAVDEAVWRLYRHVLARCGPQPSLVEWDNDVPALDVLLAQAQRAQSLLTASALPQEALA